MKTIKRVEYFRHDDPNFEGYAVRAELYIDDVLKRVYNMDDWSYSEMEYHISGYYNACEHFWGDDNVQYKLEQVNDPKFD